MRGALVGAMISGGFGAGWVLWGASGLDGPVAVTVRVLGVLVAIAVVVGALLQLRRAATGGPGDRSMFGSRAYWVTVAAEVVALLVGNRLLVVVDLPQYVIVWTAFVVAVHFLVFGRQFAPVFTAIGAAMAVAAVAGLVVGLVSGAPAAVAAVTGLACAVVLLAAGAWAVAGARRAAAGAVT